MSTSLARESAAPRGADAATHRLREVIDLHFDPKWGSSYWLRRERDLGLDARREIRELDDLARLGTMDSSALFEQSIWDFVPKSLLERSEELVVVETGGTLGQPRRSVYLESEFHAAFVAPFLAVASDFGYRRGQRWIWIGPGGPHAVGKAARAVCRAMGSPDPFTVDFDPRWFKAQAPSSIGRSRYLEHVLDQAMTILEREPIEVIFSTPPVLLELGSRLLLELRSRIEALHLGGLAIDEAGASELRRSFPASRFLSGYGNSLLGMCPQLRDDLANPSYFPHGDRLELRFVAEDVDAGTTCPGDTEPRDVAHGERGRILATRLDRSFLIANLLERDTAIRLEAPAGRVAEGFASDGLGAPRPHGAVPTNRLGIY